VDQDQDPDDPYIFWPPGSGFVGPRYGSGSGSGSGSFNHQAEIARKTLIPPVFNFFMTFFLEERCKCTFKK
jgi:hypothetical protein